MCRICGEIDYTTDIRSDSPELKAMLGVLEPGGPDGKGVWRSKHAALGHHLLSVADAAGVPQPLATNDHAVALTFNGEINNWRQLRAQLADEYDFQTPGDGEVILALYVKYAATEPPSRAAELVAQRLTGNFAFAIWDEHAETLLFVRDALGVKPLFYSPTPTGVLFGSEPKAIFAHTLGRPAIGPDGFRMLMTYVDPEHTGLWEGVPEVPPGTVVTVDRRCIRQRPFWRLQTAPHPDNLADTTARVHDWLAQIVAREVDCGAGFGALLSGGLDSTVLTALAAQATATPFPSYVIDYSGHREHFGTTDVLHFGVDADFARLASVSCGTRHTPVLLDSERLADPSLRECVVRARDFAAGLGDQDAARYLLFRHIRDVFEPDMPGHRVKKLLSGDAADELFGGNMIYRDPAALHGHSWPWLDARGRAEQDERERLLEPDFLRALDLRTYEHDTYREAAGRVDPLPGESAAERRIRVMSHLDITGHTPHLFAYTDALSMASGVEVQVPAAADPALINYLYNTPWAFKCSGGRVKGLLIDAAPGIVPGEVLARRKSGFPTTTHPAYLEALKAQARELLSRRGHVIWGIIDRGWLLRATAKPAVALTHWERRGMQVALELAMLLDIYNPSITF